MKGKYLCVLFVCLFSVVNAQSEKEIIKKELDSLYAIWMDKSEIDSSRVLSFTRYMWKGFMYNNPDSIPILTDRLLNYSKSSESQLGLALAYSTKGVYSGWHGDLVDAIGFHSKSLEISKSIDYKKGIANSLINFGLIYEALGDYPKVLKYYQQSLKISEEINDIHNIANAYNNIGLIYQEQNEYELALDYHYKSLKIKEELNYAKGISNSLSNIGRVYVELNDDRALDYLNRSIKIKEVEGDIKGLSNANNNKALYYEGKKDYNIALSFLEKGLKLREEFKDKGGIANSYYRIGGIYLIQKKYRKAIENCKKGLELATKISNIKDQKFSCKCLYDAYKSIGQFNIALGYYERMQVLDVSLRSEDTSKELQKMEFAKTQLADSLKQEEQNLKIQLAHQTEVRKKDKNKNLAIGLGVFFLLLSGGFYSRWRYVKKSKAVIEKEKDRSDNLLLNILPAEIAEELKEKGSAVARDFEMVSILFTDFQDFTKTSAMLTAKELLAEINHCFTAFDAICEKYGVEKIKTIGDAFMAAGGLPIPSDNSVRNTVLAAFEMQSFIRHRIIDKEARNEIPFRMRLGIHTGPVVAGIVGDKKFQYDIWGDTVNTAARMESSGEVGKVNISAATYKILENDPLFAFEGRGKIKAKGKGKIKMYFVTKA